MAHPDYRLLPCQVRPDFERARTFANRSEFISLHATPMFLIASYVPAFRPVNMYYTPSQW
jgi:hypothetical protein